VVKTEVGDDVSLKKSCMHPELTKYAEETEAKNAIARKVDRCNIFHFFPDFYEARLQEQSKKIVDVEKISCESDCVRLMITCKEIRFNLHGVVEEGQTEPVTNIEPFFITLALFDASIGKKISADLHVDLNHVVVRKMIPEYINQSALNSEEESNEGSKLRLIDYQWIANPKQGIFSIPKLHKDIYLVARIEKVLQGNIKTFAQPYMRSESDKKVSAKALKHIKFACQRLGHYRMPFAWSAYPLINYNNLTEYEHYMYKQESSRISDDDVIKYLSDFHKLDKNHRLEYIPCTFKIGVDSVPTDLPNILTSSLVPCTPYQHGSSSVTSSSYIKSPDAVFEVDDFQSPRSTSKEYEYLHHFYIYPKELDYTSQKTFTKARNLMVVAEFRDTDDNSVTSRGLQSFYKRPGPVGSQSAFTNRVSTSVLHHNENPRFYEEWKLELPTQLHHGHHLLFRFFHIMVDTSSKKDATYTEVGYAWMPVLTKFGHVVSGERRLPVSSNLPTKYLTVDEQQFGSKTSDVRWVDGGRPLFQIRLNLVSSLVTSDSNLHSFFDCCQRFISGSSSSEDLIKTLSKLTDVQQSMTIRFLPVVLNAIFRLLTEPRLSSQCQNECLVQLVHIVALCHSCNHQKKLHHYTEVVFVTSHWDGYESKTVHEEVLTAMTAVLNRSANDLVHKLLIQHCSFFFDIIIKSISQHLFFTDKIKEERNKRFPRSFNQTLLELTKIISNRIVTSWQNLVKETSKANESLATLFKQSFNLLDRGFIFKLINIYLSYFTSNDPKTLFECKFKFFRIICSHQHYIPLNLPLAPISKTDYHLSMSDSFCRNHFIVGLLLQHTSSALHASPDIRWIAIETFRDILAKHIFDDRYQTKEKKSRIASLYLPFLRILLDNIELLRNVKENETKMGIDDSTNSFQSSLRLKKTVDNYVKNAIANPSSSLMLRGNRGSLAPSIDSFYNKSATPSIASSSMTVIDHQDRCEVFEIQNLLLCFLQIVENLSVDALQSFWKNSTSPEVADFIEVLEISLKQFQYKGKKKNSNVIKPLSSAAKARTLPVRVKMTSSTNYNKNLKIIADAYGSVANESDEEKELLLLSNLSSQIGLIILDVISDFTRYFKKQLNKPDNKMMMRITRLLLNFLQINQSERTLQEAFASLRLVIGKFPNILFRGSHHICSDFIYQTLKSCNSQLSSTRNEACALLYLLLRKNYTLNSCHGFIRSQQQMIKSVSQLISEQVGIGSSRFQGSLSIINSFAISDQGMKGKSFPKDIGNLIKKIRTVLMSTAGMTRHKNDPEMIMDLQHKLANSYSSSPELRKTWLESMARTHSSAGNFSEAAMCYCHISALLAEHLSRSNAIQREDFPFNNISSNITKDEVTSEDQEQLDEYTYNEYVLNDLLINCAELFEKAERYELLHDVYAMVIPSLRKQRNYTELARIHERMMKSYRKVVEVNRNGKRLLATYFRVSFFGEKFFGEEDAKEFIYKEPKVTQLSEISQRLEKIFTKKFGADKVSLIQESGKVDRKKLDVDRAYIQVTFVYPYFDEMEQEHRVTGFERHHNIKHFCFETPFTPGGKARGEVDEQWKRKTICTSKSEDHCDVTASRF